MEIHDTVTTKVRRARGLSENVQIQDKLYGKVERLLTKTKPKWIKIFFGVIVLVSVSSTLVPFPMNIVVGIVGGFVGILLADHYRTNDIMRDVRHV